MIYVHELAELLGLEPYGTVQFVTAAVEIRAIVVFSNRSTHKPYRSHGRDDFITWHFF